MKITGIDSISIDKINGGISKERLSIDGKGFTDYLMNALENVSNTEKEAAKMNELLAVGDVDNLHDVMIANEKASLTLNYAISVRNKILEAYQEINKMQF